MRRAAANGRAPSLSRQSSTDANISPRTETPSAVSAASLTKGSARQHITLISPSPPSSGMNVSEYSDASAVPRCTTADADDAVSRLISDSGSA